MNKLSPLLLILILSFLMNSGCSMLRLESTWKDRDITLDGIGGDWQGAKYYFEEFAVSVGLINDTRHLYVSMMTENPLIRAQIMRQGLTVWIDPKGGKSKTFGIKFPLGRQGEGQAGDRMDPRAVMDEMDREDMMKKFQELMTELEVLGENDRVLEKIDIEDAKGIDVRMRNAGGTFVYELRIPLASSEEQPYALGVDAGDVIGIGFLSPKLQMQRQRGVRGVGGMPGGRMGFYRPQQLKIWAKIKLASTSTPAEILPFN